MFTSSHEYDIFQKVVRISYTIPDDFPEYAKDLIEKLVVTEPNERLGANENGYVQLKQHSYFESIEWLDLNKQIPPN